MFLKEADYYRQVVLKIPGQAAPGNTATIFTWDDQPDIRNARTLGIECYFANDLAASQPAGIALVPDALANLISFRFETNDPDDVKGLKGKPGNFTGTLNTIQWIPATTLHVTQSFGVAPGPFQRNHIMWKDRYIIWQKSDVWIAPGGLKNTTDMCIVLGVYYSFLDAQGKEIVR